MIITKLVHSCLLVEKDGKRALVDPGEFSWNSGIVDQEKLRDIDYVVITHAHADHIDETFASVVNELSPNAIWYVTESTRQKLLRMPGVQLETESSLGDVSYVASDHADLTHWGKCEDHTSFVLFDELFISGDCQSNTDLHGARILAGAINGGPWGAIKGELDMIAGLKHRPAKFVPLHDWHWNEQAREGFYSGLTDAMGKFGVEFVAVENGVPIEV
jgi:L-ascorbate metabolism protein UlaG (beta-lactamase superfamily)